MDNTNFVGKEGFIWWVGAIENRADPLGIGRCQVRIFGWHTSNKLKLPKDDLPWAHPMYPLNSSRTFSAPQLNEWVVGFFLDGENAQQPVMMGILPGMKKDESSSVSSSGRVTAPAGYHYMSDGTLMADSAMPSGTSSVATSSSSGSSSVATSSSSGSSSSGSSSGGY